MVIFILPTKDILRLFQKYDELFMFYNDGVKGVIRDTILSRVSTNRGLDDVLNKIRIDYLNSVDAVMEYLTEYEFRSECIDLAVELITIAINEMMIDLFKSRNSSIIISYWKWFGDDFIIGTQINPH